jgi:hypothetical protein
MMRYKFDDPWSVKLTPKQMEAYCIVLVCAVLVIVVIAIAAWREGVSTMELEKPKEVEIENESFTLTMPTVSPRTLWGDAPWFIPAMRAIAVMESSGGTNHKPNIDGIIGIGQVEECFYQDAKDYAKGTNFPSYGDLQNYDEKAFYDTCIVAWYWFKRYGADSPYLMFCRYRKGPKGEQTVTGRAYASKAMKILETF